MVEKITAMLYDILTNEGVSKSFDAGLDIVSEPVNNQFAIWGDDGSMYKVVVSPMTEQEYYDYKHSKTQVS